MIFALFFFVAYARRLPGVSLIYPFDYSFYLKKKDYAFGMTYQSGSSIVSHKYSLLIAFIVNGLLQSCKYEGVGGRNRCS